MHPIDKAYELAEGGHPGAAVAVLEQGGRGGDPNCWVELAAWYLEGRLVPRDLAKSREAFRLAAEAGHERSLEIYTAFVANGTGGQADWQAALDLLARAAKADPSADRELKLIRRMAISGDGEAGGPLER